MSRKRKAMADDDAGMIAGPGQGPALLSSKKRRVTRGDNDDDDDKATADQATRIVVEQAKGPFGCQRTAMTFLILIRAQTEQN